jgi:hypothetical protein
MADSSIPKFGFSVAETTRSTSLSRSRLYQLMASEELKYKMVGSRRIIPVSEVRRLCGDE